MNSTFWESIQAHYRAKRFAPFLEPITLDLPSGERVALRLSKITRFPETLFQVYRHTCIAEMSSPGFREEGCGEADSELLALEKAVSEALERILFRILKGSKFGTRTSNGWAAHLDRKTAEKAALFELLERDAALVHWFKREPMLEIRFEDLPRRVQRWSDRWLRNTPFPKIRILLSNAGRIPTLSTALVDERGSGVISHAASESIENALMKSLSETARLARTALSNEHMTSSKALFSIQEAIHRTGPAEQAVAYAHHQALPSWLFGEKIDATQAQLLWKEHLRRFSENPISYEYVSIIEAPLASGYCKSEEVQDLFFGRTQDALSRGLVNWRRLNQPEERINLLPHFVA